jgi:hypothetical protein
MVSHILTENYFSLHRLLQPYLLPQKDGVISESSMRLFNSILLECLCARSSVFIIFLTPEYFFANLHWVQEQDFGVDLFDI